MTPCQMHSQAVFECKLFVTYATHVTLDASVDSDMVQVVGANRVAFATRLTLVACLLLMDVSHVVSETSPTGECTWTAQTLPVSHTMNGSNVLPQPFLAHKHASTDSTLRTLWCVVAVCLPISLVVGFRNRNKILVPARS